MNAQNEDLPPHFNTASTAARINQSLVAAIGTLFSILQPVPGFVWLGVAIAITVICLFNGFSFLLTSGMWILIVVFGLLAIAYGAGVCNDVKAMGVMGTSGKLPCLCSALLAILLFVFLPHTSMSTGPKDPKLAVQYVLDQLNEATVEYVNVYAADMKANLEPTPESFKKIEKALEDFRETLAKIPTDNCPEDFRTAFIDLQQSFLTMQELFPKAIKLRDAGFLTMMGELLFGDLTSNLDELQKELKQRIEALSRVALKYGVTWKPPDDFTS